MDKRYLGAFICAKYLDDKNNNNLGLSGQFYFFYERYFKCKKHLSNIHSDNIRKPICA